MRRKDREITDPERIREIIDSCHCCRLGLCDEGRAYIVPLDFGYTKDEAGHYTLYFHGAAEGRKIDLIRRTGWAAFEMDTGHELVRGDIACKHSARYQCVMGGGSVTLLESLEEKRTGFAAIMAHATGNGDWEFPDKMLGVTSVIRLEVEELSCKVKA